MRRDPITERHAALERFQSIAPRLALVAPVVLLLGAMVSVASCTGFECQQSRGSATMLLMALAAPTFGPLLFIPGDPPFAALLGVAMLSGIPLWVLLGRTLVRRGIERAGMFDVPNWRRWWLEYGVVAGTWIVLGVAVWQLLGG